MTSVGADRVPGRRMLREARRLAPDAVAPLMNDGNGRRGSANTASGPLIAREPSSPCRLYRSRAESAPLTLQSATVSSEVRRCFPPCGFACSACCWGLVTFEPNPTALPLMMSCCWRPPWVDRLPPRRYEAPPPPIRLEVLLLLIPPPVLDLLGSLSLRLVCWLPRDRSRAEARELPLPLSFPARKPPRYRALPANQPLIPAWFFWAWVSMSRVTRCTRSCICSFVVKLMSSRCRRSSWREFSASRAEASCRSTIQDTSAPPKAPAAATAPALDVMRDRL